MKRQRILVLGADGLVGQAVFLYLHKKFPGSVWGTVRNKSHLSATLFPFSVSQCETDFESIYKKVGEVAYIINCIGVTHESDKTLLQSINAIFPHRLESIIKNMQTNLFHISSDAVFSPLCGEVTEQDRPSPVTEYGKSKLAGETTIAHAITIRSSFLGFDAYHKKGLLEKVFHTETLDFGYTNQRWSGCTTEQFAKFCADIIKTNSFERLRGLSPVFHFTPLHIHSKYLLIQKILTTYKRKAVIKRTKGQPITRLLKTSYFDELDRSIYTQQVETALQQMQHKI